MVPHAYPFAAPTHGAPTEDMDLCQELDEKAREFRVRNRYMKLDKVASYLT